uniref:Uncharacterized protein n=1 Tax=Trypanosoma congolense (strain IL3000) TaxID=1068625 RepID=G0UZ21_TRYCI|nr:hypothetical protein, unlikely [Trypanosoma congolense IL3000]
MLLPPRAAVANGRKKNIFLHASCHSSKLLYLCTSFVFSPLPLPLIALPPFFQFPGEKNKIKWAHRPEGKSIPEPIDAMVGQPESYKASKVPPLAHLRVYNTALKEAKRGEIYIYIYIYIYVDELEQ